MKLFLKLIINFYRWTLSPFVGNCCRFYPTCSEYALLAVEKHGALKGSWLSFRRICKCGPWHGGGVDFP